MPAIAYAAMPLQLREYSSSRWTSHSIRSGSSLDEELRELAVDDRLDRRERRAGRLADADEPLVGVDLDDQARRPTRGCRPSISAAPAAGREPPSSACL